jgi:TP901 family phage tail tape measure protein
MAGSNSNSRINIYVNNDEAKRKLIELDEAFRQNEEALRRLTAAGQGNTQAARDLRAEQQRLSPVIDEQRRKAGLHALSLKELRAEYRSLLNQYNRAIPGSEHRERLAAQLKVVGARLKEVEAGTQRCQSGFSRMVGAFNKYFAMAAAGIAALTGLSMKFRQLAQDVAKMDDTYSDVMKTTGMTRDEVVELNKEFKKMDTRTSREELNLLARDAGKLGITGKKDILDFVDAGNQIRVALGEDLGDDAIKNIGKMVDVFALSTKELEGMDLKGKMLAVGSAINELGQSSTASEPYMVNFAQRLGGIASQAGISIQNILGFASALDQSGQAVEMSATALSKFIMKLYEEPAKFAQLAGLEVSKFSKLLREDANSAVKQVLTALSERGGFAQLVPVFEQLGLDGARAVGVLSSLATNIGKVTEAQDIANRAFSDATSITKEYEVKNGNLQARLEKAKKEFKEVSLELGERLNPVLLKSTNFVTYLIRALVQLPDIVRKYAGALVTVTAGVIAYTVATRGASVATGLLNSALVKATKAFLTNPWTIAIAGLSLLVQAIYRVATASTAAEDAYREFSEETAKEQASAQLLFSALKDVNTTQERRKEIIEEINQRYGQYLANLLTEKSTADELSEAQERVNVALEKNIALKTRDNKISEVVAEGVEEQMSAMEKLRKKVAEQIGNDNAQLLVRQFKKVVDDGLIVYKDGALFQNFGDAANNVFKSFGLNILNFGRQVDGYYTKVKSTKEEVEAIRKAFSMYEDAPTTTSGKTSGKTSGDTPSATPSADTGTYKEELSALEKKQAARRLLLKEQHELEFGQEEKHKLDIAMLELTSLGELRKLQKKYGEDTTKTKSQIIDKTKEVNKQGYNAELKDLDEHLAEWMLHESEAMEAGQLTEEEHQANVMRRELKHLQDKLALAAANGEQTLSLEQQIVNKRIAIAQHGYEQSLKAQEAAQRKEVEALQVQLDKKEVSAEFFQHRMLAIELEGLQERLALEKAAGKDTSGTEKEIERKATASVKSLASIRKKLFKGELEERRDMELQFMEDAHKEGLLSDKKYAQKSLAIWSEYASTKAQQVGDVVNTVVQPIGTAVKAFEEAEMADNNLRREQELAALTEEYNTQMALAEGNADAQAAIKEKFEADKQKLEYDAAVENLETQKKYADANFAVQATQAAVTGIISAMNAFSALAGIPVVGPVLGAIAAAAVGVTTAMQIASLNKERQRIKSITLAAPSSTPTVDNNVPDVPKASTERIIKPEAVDESTIVKGYAGGKYDVISEEDGKRYSAPLVESVTGVVQRPTLVAERPELVVGVRDFEYLRRHINYPIVLEAIGDARQGRTVPAMAEGEYAAVGSASAQARAHGDASAMSQLVVLISKSEATLAALDNTLRLLQRDGVYANIGITELEAQQKRLAQARDRARTH